MLGEARDLVVVADASTPGALVDACWAEKADVVLTEGVFEDGTQVEEVLGDLLSTGARVAVLSDDHSPERLARILALGATGFLTQEFSPVEIVDALIALSGGAVVLDPVTAATVVEQWRHVRLDGAGAAPSQAGSRVALSSPGTVPSGRASTACAGPFPIRKACASSGR